jgi:hypothetical protein
MFKLLDYHDNMTLSMEKQKVSTQVPMTLMRTENIRYIDVAKKSVSTSPMPVKKSFKFQNKANNDSKTRSKSNLNKSLNTNIPSLKSNEQAILSNRNINSSSSNPAGEPPKQIHSLPEHLKQKQTSLSPGPANLHTINEVVKIPKKISSKNINGGKQKNTMPNQGYLPQV